LLINSFLYYSLTYLPSVCFVKSLSWKFNRGFKGICTHLCINEITFTFLFCKRRFHFYFIFLKEFSGYNIFFKVNKWGVWGSNSSPNIWQYMFISTEICTRGEDASILSIIFTITKLRDECVVKWVLWCYLNRTKER